MKNSLVSRLKSGLYTISTAAALGFGLTYCNRTPIEPSNLPQNVLDISPISGGSPLEVRVRGSCVDPDDDLKNYKIMYGSNILTITNPIDTLVNLTQSTSFNSYCEDMKGNRHNLGPINVQIIAPPPQDTLSRIAFWSNRPVLEGGYNEEIYSGDIVDIDGVPKLLNVRRLTTSLGQDLEPTWSPDGKELLFTSHRTGGTAVWRMDADGSSQRDITSSIVERARQADWCSNGKIAVAYRENGIAGIGLTDPNGTSFTPIYSEPETGQIPGWPRWSRDCSQILFQKYNNSNWEIFIMNSDGSNQRNVTNNSATDLLPIWFSDNSKIAFISDRDGTLSLYELGLNNNTTKRLTGNEGTEVDPAYSQNGKNIIFVHDLISFFNPQLYIMNSDGTGSWTQLTTEGANRYPAWRPRQ